MKLFRHFLTGSCPFFFSIFLSFFYFCSILLHSCTIDDVPVRCPCPPPIHPCPFTLVPCVLPSTFLVPLPRPPLQFFGGVLLFVWIEFHQLPGNLSYQPLIIRLVCKYFLPVSGLSRCLGSRSSSVHAVLPVDPNVLFHSFSFSGLLSSSSTIGMAFCEWSEVIV